MTRLYSLSHLTAAFLTPPEAVTLGAKVGYNFVGVRISPAAPGGAFAPLIEDKAMLKETRARIRGEGIGVFDVEMVRIAPGFRAESVMPFLETCAALGAKAVLTAGDDPEEERLIESFAAFCDAAAPFGLTADLEFMPWTEAPNVRSGLRIVERAGRPNGRLLVDSLHFERCDSTLDEVAEIPRAPQLCADLRRSRHLSSHQGGTHPHRARSPLTAGRRRHRFQGFVRRAAAGSAGQRRGSPFRAHEARGRGGLDASDA
jgi:sugar phosphate isomerase/epimerase